MVTILMISATVATLGFLKIKIIWNNGYDVMVSVYDATDKILTRDSNYFVNLFKWLIIGNPSISMIKVIITSIL